MSARQNKAFNQFPRFLWCLEAEGAESEYVYLTHTRYPRFIAFAIEGEDFEEHALDHINVVVAEEERHGLVACSDNGLHFKNFVFLDGVPDKNTLAQACLEAIANYKLLILESGIDDED